LNSIIAIFSSFLIFLICNAAVAQTGTFKINETLRAEPGEQSGPSGNVSAGSKFEVIERKGFWAKVKADRATGWAKLSGLNLDAGSSGGSGNPAALLGGLASGRTGSGNIVSASGTRGLSAEELATAKPDMNAVEQVKRQAVAAGVAANYAQSAGLGTRQIDYLPASAVETQQTQTKQSR